MTGYSKSPSRENTDVVGLRIGAQIVDTIVILFLLYIPVVLVGGFGGLILENGGALSSIGLLVGVSVSFIYWFLIEGFWDGYTVGKRIFGIKVVEEDGSECSLSSALVRNLLEFIDGMFYYIVGLIAIAISDKRQRIGDRIAGTVVVREEN